jgi:uncharacterized membrane protein YsdA (DUF1294 family)
MIGEPSPTFRFGLVAFALTMALALAVWQLLVLDGLMAWLLAVNLVTLLGYGYDKLIAGSHRTRVPERVLLVLALAGGTPGAFLGMRVFRHKTSKGSFRFKVCLAVLVQAVVIAVYYWMTWRNSQ